MFRHPDPSDLRQAAAIFSACLALAACHDQARGGGAGARDEIRVVGSSTVFPFTTLVAEQFVAGDPEADAPVIESTGTGAGIDQFCDGLGASHPDIVNASRRLTAAEYRACRSNEVGPVIEVQVGIDGIALAQAQGGPRFALTPKQIYRALAVTPGGRPNTARRWSDIDPSLPAVPISVYGPPTTSGTRDAFVELIMLPGCAAADSSAAALEARDPQAYRARCSRVREDGVYVDAGENDNLIVQKLAANPTSLGIFGYSYLEENSGSVVGVPVNGVQPSDATIAAGSYPGSRPLYLYVKKNHLEAVPGLRRFLQLYAASWGPDGPLSRRGLIPSPAPLRARAAETIKAERPLDPAELA
ncbi:substrate-binding domain-containing protein [Sphingomonas lenta]|uniref:Phosphate ABC transporter substrate-binding protein n=1 Tax=Sphingomonas lenta TaxID=1141887 RepID=A0A2A2SHB8_9SPHN|nr:substrate-binding domain-containing protein [Sphingomonas lenta]PAX08570.1 phosphate ABC transporter substrate-binding protein [Sphingomonas lenta]